MESIETFIAAQPADRQKILATLHGIIISADPSVKAGIEPMMGKEMIVYKSPGMFKYGLSSMKNYMSLHIMPIYGSPTLYSRYKELLPDANFQKGCINFKNEKEVPPGIIKQLFQDCSKIDLLTIKAEYTRSKKR